MCCVSTEWDRTQPFLEAALSSRPNWEADRSGLCCSLNVVFLAHLESQPPSRREEDGAGDGDDHNMGSDTPANGLPSRAPERLFILLEPAEQLGPFLGGPPV